MAPLPTLKLTYFDLAARAEGTRVMLRLGGVPFEDERVSRADFATKLKATLPYGQVPVLTVNGELLAETQAIQRYAARVAGMYPLDDPLAALMVEELITTVSDLYETKVIASMREQDPEKKLKMRQAMATELLPTALRQIEARLQQLAEYAYFKKAEGKMFAHEVVLSMFIATLQSGRVDHVPTTIADGYARIMATHKRVQDAIKDGQVISSPPAFPVTPATQKPQKLKLTYFDIPARGEFIRLALHIGGVAFEDERITYADMPARKPALPFGQLPALEVDGVVLAQSFALLRYASVLSGLYPVHDPLAAARMDEIIARVEEVYHTFQASFDTKDPEERRAIRERLLAANAIQSIFSTLEKRIQQWQKTGPFVFGETLSIADLAVYHIVDFLKSGDFDYVPVTIADEFATLVGIHAAVLSHPRVKDWYATRPAK